MHEMLCLIPLNSIELTFVRVDVKFFLIVRHSDTVDSTLTVEFTESYRLPNIKESNLVKHTKYNQWTKFDSRYVLSQNVFFKGPRCLGFQIFDIKGLEFHLNSIVKVSHLIVKMVPSEINKHVGNWSRIDLWYRFVRFHCFKINDLDTIVGGVIHEAKTFFFMKSETLQLLLLLWFSNKLLVILKFKGGFLWVAHFKFYLSDSFFINHFSLDLRLVIDCDLTFILIGGVLHFDLDFTFLHHSSKIEHILVDIREINLVIPLGMCLKFLNFLIHTFWIWSDYVNYLCPVDQENDAVIPYLETVNILISCVYHLRLVRRKISAQQFFSIVKINKSKIRVLSPEIRVSLLLVELHWWKI